ncbi:MAG: hypothetical protein ACKO6L_10055, partial [Flavobacteriales bacterium]
MPKFFDVRMGKQPGEIIIHPHRVIVRYDTIHQPWYWKELDGEPYQWRDGNKVWTVPVYDEDPDSYNYGLPIGEKELVKTTDDPILEVREEQHYILSDLVMGYTMPKLIVEDGKKVREYAFDLIELDAEVIPTIGNYSHQASIHVDDLKLNDIKVRFELDELLVNRMDRKSIQTITDTMFKADVVGYELIIMPEGGIPCVSQKPGSYIGEGVLNQIRKASPCSVCFSDIKAACWDGTTRILENVCLNIKGKHTYKASSKSIQVVEGDAKGRLPGFRENHQHELYQFVFNPLEVSFEGRICQDFELSSRDAVIEATEQSNVFNIKPIVDGSVEILVSGTCENEVLVDTLRFNSIVLPVEPRFGSIHAGTSKALTTEFGYRAL